MQAQRSALPAIIKVLCSTCSNGLILMLERVRAEFLYKVLEKTTA